MVAPPDEILTNRTSKQVVLRWYGETDAGGGVVYISYERMNNTVIAFITFCPPFLQANQFTAEQMDGKQLYCNINNLFLFACMRIRKYKTSYAERKLTETMDCARVMHQGRV